ncbi:hypothetical protein C8R44DRAFT_75663 [Mycena epipterygia]|nr:hypothetical protein C8R44DRAFT_75663 [Mycena epipterygia]
MSDGLQTDTPRATGSHLRFASTYTHLFRHPGQKPLLKLSGSDEHGIAIPVPRRAGRRSQNDSDMSTRGLRRRKPSSSDGRLSSQFHPSSPSPLFKIIEPETVANPITAFLSNSCSPPMAHCAPALQRAGVTSEAHLIGMAHWSAESMRSFLDYHKITHTALEEYTLIYGFACLLAQYNDVV